ncbi:unnamed protein product [Adineta ricciae]|uniref:DJ-1/PfpI domain-containing protein n=1 Tax=Adineta ricciae TaxID=249248 RepID=A0A815NI08_ADIRI|nr:unnamed protein product [Adineta ricciae]CAF1437865.1 unnamed protein product [Adineta ricciae]
MGVFIFTTNKINAVSLASLFRKRGTAYVISADITQLTDDYDVLIVPGGTAKRYEVHLGENGIALIQNFVANGGVDPSY